MPKDRFDPVRPVSRFLAEQAEQDIGNIRDEGVVLARLFKVSLLVAAVAVTGIAVLALGNPLAVFSDATASLVGSSSPKPGTAQPAPAVQSAANAPALVQPPADAQGAPPTATDAPAHEEVAAAEPAGKTTDPSSEALFRQFQAWVVEQDAQPKAEPVQPVQDAAPTPIMQEAAAPAAEDVHPARRLAPKHRQDQALHNAQAEPRSQSVRRPVPRAQEARAARPPARQVQDARAQEPPPPPPQPAQAPSGFPSFFGQRN
jgi:hypothetical protein